MVARKKRCLRGNLFENGHSPWNKCDNTADLQSTSSPTESLSSTSSVSSSNSDISTSDPSSLLQRPRKRTYDEAIKSQSKWAQCKETQITILPSKLRPKKEDNTEEIGNCSDSKENIIVLVSKLSELVEVFLPHSCRLPVPTCVVARRQGMCVTVQILCKTCGFKSEMVEMFERIEKNNIRQYGPRGGMINEALVLPMLKTKCGPSDISTVLSSLNIKPPSAPLLQHKLNKAAEKMEAVNKESMLENQDFVKDVHDLIGHDNYVDLETDTSYNNRPQAGGEAATQSFTPLVELSTTQKLTLAFETKNKLCSSQKPCNHENCKKNYSTEESISSSEAKSLQKNLTKLNENGKLKVNSITCDASAQIAKVVREFSNQIGEPIRQYTCFIHKMRTVQRHIRNLKLIRTPPGINRDTYIQRLATIIRGRVRAELVRIRKKFHQESWFAEKAMAALKNIVPCLSGKHRNCRQNSLVCIAHLESYSTKFLPCGEHLQLIPEDEQNLSAAICKSLSLEELRKLSRLLNTNKSESLHNRVFTYAPKNTVWSRNFNGLCHSAVHSATFGTGKSALILAHTIGLKYSKNDPFLKYMVRRDQIDSYKKMMNQTPQYKSKRYLSRILKCNRKNING